MKFKQMFSEESWTAIMDRLWKEHFVIPMEINNVFIYSFKSIFSMRLATNHYR